MGECAQAIREYGSANDEVDACAAHRFGINRTDLRVLDVLERDGPMTPGRISEAASLTSGAVTALVDRLEKKGYVRRRRDPKDRRKVLVEVTPKMKRIAQEIYLPIAEEGYKLMARYSEKELALIRDFLLRGRDLLKKHASDWLLQPEPRREAKGQRHV